MLLAVGCSLAIGLILGAVGAHALWRPAASANPAQATAQKWLTALKAKDLTAMEALFAANGTFKDAATGEKAYGGARAEDFGWAVVFPTVRAVKDARILALADGMAVVTYTLYGTPPSSPKTPIDVPMVSILRVRNGHITDETIYYDHKTVFGYS